MKTWLGALHRYQAERICSRYKLAVEPYHTCLLLCSIIQYSNNLIPNTNTSPVPKMRFASTILALTSAASGMVYTRTDSSSNETTTSGPNVVAAQYDGKCFYPVPDPKFNLDNYLGTWYQVAGTPFGPTAGARCVTANYQLNVCPSFL